MTRAVDLLKTNFGVSQLYTYDVIKEGKTLFTVYWHPLTLAEREIIVKQAGGNLIDNFNDYSLQLMITKSLDKEGNRIFQDGDKASLRREVEATILEQIQVAMINAGEKGVDEAKADLKSE